MQLKPTSIEKETFPAMAAEQQLHWMDLPGFWMDVGQPKDYLSGMCLYLSYLTSQKSKVVVDPSQNPWVHGGNVIVDPVRRLSLTVATDEIHANRSLMLADRSNRPFSCHWTQRCYWTQMRHWKGCPSSTMRCPRGCKSQGPRLGSLIHHWMELNCWTMGPNGEYLSSR